MKSQKSGSPHAAAPRAVPLEQEPGGSNPRNVPVAPLDGTPPHGRARKPTRPATAGQDDIVMDTETLIDPPPNAPHLGHERING